MKVYYDFIFPNQNEIEPGLYRRYFKYTSESIKGSITPYFKEKYKNNIEAYSDRAYRIITSSLRRFPTSICNDKKDADILHLFLRIPLDLSTPWISECETIDQFSFYYNRNAYSKGFLDNFHKILSQKNFKHIIVSSNRSKEVFDYFNLPSEKISVIRPIVLSQKKKEHVDKKNLKILFNFGSNPLFFSKGGKEVIESFKILKNSFPELELLIVGNDDKKKIELISGVTFMGYLQHDFLINNILSQVDILVHPTHMDTFGYVIAEAMACGLPVIATKHYAIPEIIQHEVNGFLIDDIKNVWYDENFVPKYNYYKNYARNDSVKYTKQEFNYTVNNLVNYLKMLIEDAALRQELGNNNYMKVSDGDLSLGKRNGKLLDIYNNSIS